MTGILLGLGLSELAFIAAAVILLMGPKSIRSIKPFIKAAYKGWVRYQREVELARRELDEVKDEVMGPIKEAEEEAVSEMRGITKEISAPMKEIQRQTREIDRAVMPAKVSGRGSPPGTRNAKVAARFGGGPQTKMESQEMPRPAMEPGKMPAGPTDARAGDAPPKAEGQTKPVKKRKAAPKKPKAKKTKKKSKGRSNG